MAYNKIIYGGNTLIDLTSDTITADKLAQGYTAHDRSGTSITGSMEPSQILVVDTTDEHGGTIRTITGKVVTMTTKSITQNGTYNAEDDNYDGYSSVTVNVQGSSPTIQSLNVTPSASQQTFNSSSVDGYKPVVVAGDSDLVASNIVNGVQIFGVTGNVVLQNYYTGSSAPSSSLGSNGDLYLQS